MSAGSHEWRADADAPKAHDPVEIVKRNANSGFLIESDGHSLTILGEVGPRSGYEKRV
jgi:hypothetical protein